MHLALGLSTIAVNLDLISLAVPPDYISTRDGGLNGKETAYIIDTFPEMELFASGLAQCPRRHPVDCFVNSFPLLVLISQRNYRTKMRSCLVSRRNQALPIHQWQ